MSTSEADLAEITISLDGASWRLAPGEEFTFGRGEGCTVCLDPDDVGLSRLAGSVEFHIGAWWLYNRSANRPLTVVNHLGLRSVLAPGLRYPVEGSVAVVVDGSHRSHRLELTGPEPPGAADPTETGLATAVGQQVVITDDDRLALVALFVGYLRDGSRYDPHPQSYLAAATRLGWPRTTLVKRIEYLRTRLARAGVPNMNGHRALEYLAEHALTTGLITRADLRLIGG